MFFSKLLKKNKNKKSTDFSKNNFRSPEVLGVNLVKDEVIVFFDWSKYLLLSVIVFVVVGLFIFEIYSGLSYWEKQENIKAEELKTKTDILKMEVLNLNKEHAAALSFRDKSGAFSDLLENHVYFTKFFDWLQKNTLSTIKYTGFAGDLTGKYSLRASAPSYAEVSWQAKAFANSDVVKNVKIEKVSIGGEEEQEEGKEGEAALAGTVSFTIELEIKPEIFRQQE